MKLFILKGVTGKFGFATHIGCVADIIDEDIADLMIDGKFARKATKEDEGKFKEKGGKVFKFGNRPKNAPKKAVGDDA